MLLANIDFEAGCACDKPQHNANIKTDPQHRGKLKKRIKILGIKRLFADVTIPSVSHQNHVIKFTI